MILIVIGVGLTIGIFLGSMGITGIIYLQAQAASWVMFALGAMSFGLAVIQAVMSIYRARPLTDVGWSLGIGMWCWALVVFLHTILPSVGQTVVSQWLMAFLETPS